MFKASIISRVYPLWRNYPIELLLSVTAALLAVLGTEIPLTYEQRIFCLSLVLTYPMSFCVVYLINYYQHKLYRWSWLYAIVLGFLMWIYPLKQGGRVWSSLLIIHCLLFFAKGLPRDNRQFIHNILQSLRHFIFAFLLTLVVIGLVLSLFLTANILFNLHFSNDWIESVNIAIVVFFNALFFLYFEQNIGKYNSQNQRLRPVSDVLINGLFSPIVIIYTAIVYVYLATILIAFELPVGRVSTVILPYLCLGLLCIAVRQFSENPKWNGFFRHFAKFALIPLGLLWLGIIERITTYGFTEPRVYLVAFSILVTLFIVCSLNHRWLRYWLFATMSIVMIIILLIFTPERIANASQYQRFVQLATEMELLDHNGALQREKLEEPLDEENQLIELAYQLDQNDTIQSPDVADLVVWLRQAQNRKSNHLNDEEKELTDYFSYSNRQPLTQKTEGYREFVLLTDNDYFSAECVGGEHITLMNAQSSISAFSVNRAYVQNLLQQSGIEPGKRYTEQVLNRVAPRLMQLPTATGELLILHSIDFKYCEQPHFTGYDLMKVRVAGFLKP